MDNNFSYKLSKGKTSADEWVSENTITATACNRPLSDKDERH